MNTKGKSFLQLTKLLIILILVIGFTISSFNTNNLFMVRAEGDETSTPEATESPTLMPIFENDDLQVEVQNPIINQMKIIAVELLTEQFSLDQIDHSIVIENVIVEENSARADIVLTTQSDLGEVVDQMKVYALHDGNQLLQVFREPSEDYYLYIDQVSPNLINLEDVQFWKSLRTQEQQDLKSLDTSINDNISISSVLYKLPWDGGTRYRGYNYLFAPEDNKHFDFSTPEGVNVRAARGGKIKNGIGIYGEYYVRILHSDGTYGYYIHLKANSFKYANDATVVTGNCIAISGNTGKTGGPHTHFNVTTESSNLVESSWIPVQFAEGVIHHDSLTPYSQNLQGSCTVSLPTTPTNVGATDGTNNDYVRISWNAVSGATSYEVWRNVSNTTSGATKRGTVTSTSYDDTSATPLIPYFYWVKACNSSGCSGYSSSNAGYRGQDGVILLDRPTLTPPYSGDMCGSAWHQVTGFGDAKAFLTLNTNQSSQSTNSGVWQPTLPVTGVYKVEAYIPNHPVTEWECPTKTISSDTSDAKYTVGEQPPVSRDQAPLANAWLSLGNFTFNAGSTGKVKLVDLNSEASLTRTISFSAMRFTLISVSPPVAFNKSTPANGVGSQSTTPTISWNSSNGSTSYEYCYDTSNDNACDSDWVSNGTALSKTLNGLSAGTTYYWQVRGGHLQP